MFLLFLLTLSIVLALGMFYKLGKWMRYFKPGKIGELPSLDELPTVTVCIPARNERHAMASCLEAVVASDYPKLEIIVLDDGSRDNTSLLIKSFAHAGVRFVEGGSLPAGWLGKNFALDTLLDEASGKYVFFMDVDTRIRPQTISRMVSYVLAQQADMLSVLPLRHPEMRVSTLFTTMRFFWEVVGHRPSHPASVSTAWMIRKNLLAEELGGLEAFATATRPDAAVAQKVAQVGRYRFVIGTPELGISYEKKLSSQLQTSLRLTFPALGSNWLRSLAAASTLVLALVPYMVVIAAPLYTDTLAVAVALAAIVLQYGIFGIYIKHVWAYRWWLLGVVVLPVLLIIELWIVLASAMGYSRRTITWKGRPIAATVEATSLKDA